MTSDYEKIRLRNIEDNKRILAELGLVNPYKPLPRIIKRSNNYLKRKRDSFDTPSSKRIKVASSATPEAADSWTPGTRRRSRRLLGKDAPDIKDIEDVLKEEDDAEEDEEDEDFRPKISKDRPQVYGAIPGVEVGTHWMTRMEANYAGVHRPVVAGIHPGPQGAYSIALSGGYEDDLDYGECFTYTGEGGRDLKGTKANPKNLRTAPQSKHQTLSRGNKALVDSAELGHPVRVLRGFKLSGPFAPEVGYRYDGLYKVDKWWYTEGLAGFNVYKFALSRLKDQPPPPWYMNTETGDVIVSNENSVDADSKRERDEEKNMKRAKTENEADSDSLKENKNADESCNSPASDNHGKKEPLKAVGSVSEDGLKVLEKNGKITENIERLVPEDLVNDTSKSLDKMSRKTEAVKNDTGKVSNRTNTNNENFKNNTNKRPDGASSKISTDSRDETKKTDSIVTVNMENTGIDINRSPQKLSSTSSGDQVMDETNFESSTRTLCDRNSNCLSKDVLVNSVNDQSNKSYQAPQATCSNEPLEDNSQESGIANTQPQATSDAGLRSVEFGDVLTTIPRKLDENKNITLS